METFVLEKASLFILILHRKKNALCCFEIIYTVNQIIGIFWKSFFF